MSVMDLTSAFAVVALIVLRVGMPLLGIWFLGKALKQVFPSTP